MKHRFGKIENGKMILNEYGEIAHKEWLQLVERFPNMEMDVFQIMPNHMHSIIAITVGSTLAVDQHNAVDHCNPVNIDNAVDHCNPVNIDNAVDHGNPININNAVDHGNPVNIDDVVDQADSVDIDNAVFYGNSVNIDNAVDHGNSANNENAVDHGNPVNNENSLDQKNSVNHNNGINIDNTVDRYNTNNSDISMNRNNIPNTDSANLANDLNKKMKKESSPASTVNVGDIVGAYKSLVFNGCLELYKSKDERMGKLWQRNYYEHIIRNEQSYQNISNYIINNPAKWGADKFYKK
jgi:REP element-mobilizing transposase RayT